MPGKFLGKGKMTDPVTAVIATGLIGIGMAIIAKLRCFWLTQENEETGHQTSTVGCGFMETQLFPSSSRVEQVNPERDGSVLIFRR